MLEASRRAASSSRAIGTRDRVRGARRRPDGAGVPLAFVRDFVGGKFQGSFDDAADVHAWPQVADEALLSGMKTEAPSLRGRRSAYVALHVRERQPVHLVADLGAMARAAVGGLAGAGGDWPPPTRRSASTTAPNASRGGGGWKTRSARTARSSKPCAACACPTTRRFGALGFELPDGTALVRLGSTT